MEVMHKGESTIEEIIAEILKANDLDVGNIGKKIREAFDGIQSGTEFTTPL